MRNKEIKIALISLAAFTLLYIISLFVTQALILDEALKHFSAIPWALTFAVPAYILARHGNNKWYFYGASVTIAGNLIWLLHSQLLFMGIFPVIKVLSNSILCFLGAYVGSKLKASNKALKAGLGKKRRAP